ncbi:hypothetical protein Salat_2971900 [Sesamum alatum]|uniref:Uncharacterized protein n=1 Tax=Sesamum alatum TaxID=300844 RepID=A0AAE2C7N8_9LAMI|nr:hypothetical protein Salat_2971900 [Sesamum alatum]
MPVTTIDYYTITVDEDLYQWPVSECAKTLIGIGRFLLGDKALSLGYLRQQLQSIWKHLMDFFNTFPISESERSISHYSGKKTEAMDVAKAQAKDVSQRKKSLSIRSSKLQCFHDKTSSERE